MGNMDKVYIVTAGEYDDFHTVAVYLNRDDAKATFDRLKNAAEPDYGKTYPVRLESWIVGDESVKAFDDIVEEYWTGPGG